MKEIDEIPQRGYISYPILDTGNTWQSTEDLDLDVMETGPKELLLDKMISSIDKAAEMVCLQSFLIQDFRLIDALISATERGVKVFVLSSVDARLKETIEEEEDWIKDKYVKLLENKFCNTFVHRSAENLHGKYLLVDPRSKPQGYLTTMNFTVNGFNKNPELAIEMTEAQCQEFFQLFVYTFWELCTDEQTATKRFDKVKPAGKYAFPKFSELLCTMPVKEYCSLNRALLSAVQQAKKSIMISTFILDKDMELIKLLIDKAKNGVEVKVFCRVNNNLYRDNLKPLVDAGIKVYLHPYMHAKSLLVDGKEAYVFTANFIKNGLLQGVEVGIKLSESQLKSLDDIQQRWEASFPYELVALLNDEGEYEYFQFVDKKLTKCMVKIIPTKPSDDKNEALPTVGKLAFKPIDLKDIKNEEFIKNRIIETWDEKREFFNLSALNGSFLRAIEGFSYKALGFGSFKVFCLSLNDFFDIDVTENLLPKILPKMPIRPVELEAWLKIKAKRIAESSKAKEDEVVEEQSVTREVEEARQQFVKNLTVELMSIIIADTWDVKRKCFNFSTLNDALMRRIPGFRYKQLAYVGFRAFSLLLEDYLEVNIQEGGMAVILPKINIDTAKIEDEALRSSSKPKIKPPAPNPNKIILPIPFDKAREAFEKCETDQDGWVNTKVYYRSLCIAIKGFNPVVYGGRFNYFYKSLDFIELKVINKDLKMLRMK